MRTTEGNGTVTVLFTDLVGSTELLARLGEGAFDEVRREHFARLREAIVTHHGEELKSTGDGLMATFASAAEAVASAVAMQQATDRQAKRGSAPLAIRVGLALGDVAFEGGDVFGTPVVEAARLVATAKGGQILATTVVRVVAGGRTGADFTDVGPLRLKGLAEPVAACEVAWEPAPATSTLPLPSLLTKTGRIFVGREAELERCLTLWKEAAEGERRVALLAGEPGIGKTRLAAQLAGALHGEGAMVLAGRCDEDLGVPYQPFVEALRHYAAHARSPRLGRYGGELTRLVPELAGIVPGLSEPLHSDPETERYRLFDALAAWLSDLSAETPVLLVLDDLQWGAKPTLLLLRHVLRSPEPLRLLVVVTYRDTDVGRAHPLFEFLADSRKEQGYERLALSGLDRAAVEDYMEAAGGHELGEEGEALARVVWSETDGHPFFMTEVLRNLAESGALERREGRWVTTASAHELGIPEGVRDVIGRRLSRLAPGTDRMLQAASVVGLEFDPALVLDAGSLGEEELFSALEEASRARLVAEVPGARYRFAHALVRSALYDELSGPRRAALHRRVAMAIETLHATALDDHLPALAHHYARATAPSDTEKALSYAERAGDRALGQLANDEAASYYRRALELLEGARNPEHESRRLGLLISLGEAQRRAGDPAHRETLLAAAQLAKERGDVDALARAALANTRGLYMTNVGAVDPERVAALEAALAATSETDSPLRARLLATLALETVFAGQRERRLRLSDEALACARRVGDPATLAGVLLARPFAIHSPATLGERLRNSAEAQEIAGAIGDPVLRCRAAFSRIRPLLEAGEMEAATSQLATAEALASELGQPTLAWLAGWHRAGRLLNGGCLEEAEASARASFELGQRTGQADAALHFLVLMAQVRRDQGRLGAEAQALEEIVARWPGVSGINALLVEAYLELGRPNDARVIFDPLAAGGFAALPVDFTWMGAVVLYVAVASRLGDRAAALALYELLSPYADQVAVMAGAISGSVTHHLGVLAVVIDRFEEAEAHFGAAAATHQRIGAPVWLARTRLEWAGMLLGCGQAGDVERARYLLSQALATARELGLASVERQAVALQGG